MSEPCKEATIIIIIPQTSKLPTKLIMHNACCAHRHPPCILRSKMKKSCPFNGFLMAGRVAERHYCCLPVKCAIGASKSLWDKKSSVLHVKINTLSNYEDCTNLSDILILKLNHITSKNSRGKAQI